MAGDDLVAHSGDDLAEQRVIDTGSSAQVGLPECLSEDTGRCQLGRRGAQSNRKGDTTEKPGENEKAGRPEPGAQDAM